MTISRSPQVKAFAMKATAFIGACACHSIAFSQPVQWVSTTAKEYWVSQSISFEASTAPAAEGDLVIQPKARRQTVEGFGGAFNELGWDILQVLPEKDQDKIIDALFGTEGANFSMGRTPVGSSDYALSYYSYCDVKDDYGMRDFSIARDRYILIPYLKKALKIRPDLKIWASPWTPPAWMKINEHYSLQGGDIDGRPGGNEMDRQKNVLNNATAFNMRVGYLRAYALYLAKYVMEYQNQGIRIWALMPQNEIAWSPNWPSCTWRPEDLALFIGKYLGPEFERDGLKTEIWLGTINYPNPAYVRTVLQENGAQPYIKGIGFQWTGSKAIGTIHSEYPAYNLMQTENMCGNGENNWASMEKTWDSVVHYFRNNVSSYMYWNLILDETGKSSWGWPQNSLVVIDRKTRQVRYTDEYYLMKHLSHFIRPGAVRLETSDEKNALAFEAEGKTVAVVYNPLDSDRGLSLFLKGKSARVSLKSKSINTFVIPD